LSDHQSWPAGAPVAVSFTVDFDADVGMDWRKLDGRLTSTSEARFGAVRGIWRLLDLFAEKEIRATFYVPGEIARRYPEEVRAIVSAGHEVGHHGHVHLFNDRIDLAGQRAEMDEGIDALIEVAGVRPSGYRSPGWELTPETIEMLVERGFVHDSSCMGDDRPYVERHGSHSILEMPVHWSLDDWVYYGFTRDGGGPMADPDAMYRCWLREFESAVEERRHVTYTLHPECAGRGYRSRTVGMLIDQMRAVSDVWFAPHAAVADVVTVAP
jgi:peptidoglycan-N-acetylglucosamine deacetylase